MEGTDEVARELDIVIPEDVGEVSGGGRDVAEVDDEIGEDAVGDAQIGRELRADLRDEQELRETPHPIAHHADAGCNRGRRHGCTRCCGVGSVCVHVLFIIGACWYEEYVFEESHRVHRNMEKKY